MFRAKLKTKLVDSDDGELPRLVAQQATDVLDPTGDDSSSDDQHGRDEKPRQRRGARKLAGARGDERQQQKRHPGASPADQRADDLPMLRNPVPVAVHVADFGQQIVDDDRHGGGNDVVVDRGRQSALHGDCKPHHNAHCVGEAIPHPPCRPFLVDVLAILHDRLPRISSTIGHLNATGISYLTQVIKNTFFSDDSGFSGAARDLRLGEIEGRGVVRSPGFKPVSCRGFRQTAGLRATLRLSKGKRR